MTDVLKSSIEDAIRRQCAPHGVEPSFLGQKGDEEAVSFHVIVSKPDATRHVSISRIPTFDEGDHHPGFTFIAKDAALHADDERKVARFVAETMRMRARETAVRPFRRSGMSPAWSYAMHPVARMLMIHAGEGRTPTFAPVADNRVRMARIGRRGKTGPLATGRALRVTPGEFLGQFGRGIVEARGERIFAHDLEIGVRADKGPEAIFVDIAAPELVVYGVTLPETAIAGCQGLDLSQVVGHPAFGENSGVHVLHASNEDGYLRIRLPAGLEPVAEAPAGADVSWSLSRT